MGLVKQVLVTVLVVGASMAVIHRVDFLKKFVTDQ